MKKPLGYENKNRTVIAYNPSGRTDRERHLISLEREDRRQHQYIIGKSGTGKSTMLQNMIAQDILFGRGVAVIDPHGSLVENILQNDVPRWRTNDVVYFNPQDKDFPCGLNLLDGYGRGERDLAASSLVSVFKHIWADSWGPRLEYVLYNAVAALLERPGSDLLDVYRLLSERDFRKKVSVRVTDPVISSFWTKIFPEWGERYASEAVAPVLNKVGQLLSSETMRGILCRQHSTIDVGRIMNDRKILLVNLSKGTIGEDRANLLGSVITTKIYLAALQRSAMGEQEREDFYLYVDEFQNFATDTFGHVLSEARKYRLNIILANQFLSQLDPKIQEAVIGNVGTLCVFRVGSTDAERLAKEFHPYHEHKDLHMQNNFALTYRMVERSELSRPGFAQSLPPVQWVKRKAKQEEIIRRSREVYGKRQKN